MSFTAEHHHHLLLLRKENRCRVVGGAVLLWAFLMLATPRVPHSPAHHLFADMRNFLGSQSATSISSNLYPWFDLFKNSLSISGVPNTLNVLTCYPFLLVGVPGLVLCLSGTCFGIRHGRASLLWFHIFCMFLFVLRLFFFFLPVFVALVAVWEENNWVGRCFMVGLRPQLSALLITIWSPTMIGLFGTNCL